MDKAKKRKFIAVAGTIGICLLIAIIVLIIVIRLRIETSFNASYDAYQVNCNIKQKMIEHKGNGAVKENGVKEMEDIHFDATSKNEVKKSAFPAIELFKDNNVGLDYVVYSTSIENTDEDTTKAMVVVLDVALDEESNLKYSVTYRIGGEAKQELLGSTVDGKTKYTFPQVQAGQTIVIDVKLEIDDHKVDIDNVSGSLRFNLRSNQI